MSKLALFPMWFVPFLFALCFHEFAHGFVAKLRGDNTAKLMGRLTLNPIAHMDLIGTLLFPLLGFMTNSRIFFGWAKPVPVNARNLKNPRVDMFWIALAGPLSNVLLAVITSFIMFLCYRMFYNHSFITTLFEMLDSFMVTNLFLAVFNIIPMHPLDGGKVLARFLPESLNQKLEQNEQMLSLLLFVFIMAGATQVLIVPVKYAHYALTFWERL